MDTASKNEKSRRVSQVEVARYIMAHLLPESGTAPIPFRERELARTLRTNRLTVRRVCENLLRHNILFRQPGKRGLYLNPKCREKGLGEKYYGVLHGNGEIPVLGYNSNLILKGFFDYALNNSYIDCQFLTLTTTGVERVVAEIMSYPLHALIWFSPPPTAYPIIEQLLEKSLPTAVVLNPLDSRLPAFPTNTFLLDHEKIGRFFADAVIDSGYRAVLFAGLKSTTFDAFKTHLNENDIAFSQKDFLEYDRERYRPEQVTRLIRQRKIELVVADGTLFHDLDEIVSPPEMKKLHFLFPPLRHVLNKAVKHPELHILFPDFSFDNTLLAMGKAVAKKLHSGPCGADRFPNQIIAPLQKSQP